MKIIPIILLTLFSLNTFAADTDNEKINSQHQIIENAISQIDNNLSANNFEKMIEKKYHATYYFLENLSQKQKKEVYEYYKNESDFSVIRHKIFDLFFGIS